MGIFQKRCAGCEESISQQTKTPLKQNVYGATIGGPVILPYYGRKHHTFFFGAYEGTSINSASQSTSTTFLQTLNWQVTSAPSTADYNPFSTFPTPIMPVNYLRTPFPNNQIPQSLLDPRTRSSLPSDYSRSLLRYLP